MAPSSTSPEPDVFDYALSLAQIGADPGLLEKLVVAYLRQLPQMLPRIAEAVRRRDPQALRNTAHALSSATNVVSASRTRAAARRLELMGRNNELAEVEMAHADLCREVDRLCHALAAVSGAKAR
jgi:HPt (histidine-containing phosphotransfer) domain-containing protein